MRRNILFAALLGLLLLGALVVRVQPASSAPTAAYTAYAPTGLADPQGIAAAGHYVWITDLGVDLKASYIYRIDAATGDAQKIKSNYGALLSQVVASPRYAWVMVAKRSALGSSLLRVNAQTLVVQQIKIPSAQDDGVAYTQGPIFLAGDYVWIPGPGGIVRVNTTTLKTSAIRSTLMSDPLSPAVDSHYLWLNSSQTQGSNRFFLRVSLVTGAVTKVDLPGVPGGFPIGDDGTNLWVGDHDGTQRINPTTDQLTTIPVSENVQITLPLTGPSAVVDGAIFFHAGLAALHRDGVVRIGISSKQVTVLSSPLLYDPNMIAAANGVLWVLNFPTAQPSARQPVLVRVSWPSQS
jgi:hypothetical protein